MLKNIVVRKLFGRFNYNLSFYPQQVSLITGANGLGKTTILKIIDGVLNDHLMDIIHIPFESIELSSTQGHVLTLSQKDDAFFINSKRIIRPATGNAGQGPGEVFVDIDPKDLAYLKNTNRRLIYNPFPVTKKQLEYPEGPAATADPVLLLNDAIDTKTASETVKDVLAFYSDIGNASFLGVNRIGKTGMEILDLSKRMSDLFQQFINAYFYSSIRFGPRLIARIYRDEKPNYDEPKLDVTQMTHILEKLKYYGVDIGFDTDISSFNGIHNYSSSERLFLSECQNSLEIFAPFLAKLDLYESLINHKLIGKKISISQKKGIRVLTEVPDQSSPAFSEFELAANKLSSGEQEILYLYFEILFGDDNNLLALIDEPENSLHVIWQECFVEDVEKLARLRKETAQIIICTHSPQIIGMHIDEIQDLGIQARETNVLQRPTL